MLQGHTVRHMVKEMSKGFPHSLARRRTVDKHGEERAVVYVKVDLRLAHAHS